MRIARTIINSSVSERRFFFSRSLNMQEYIRKHFRDGVIALQLLGNFAFSGYSEPESCILTEKCKHNHIMRLTYREELHSKFPNTRSFYYISKNVINVILITFRNYLVDANILPWYNYSFIRQTCISDTCVQKKKLIFFFFKVLRDSNPDEDHCHIKYLIS